jgi:hypothetical protein
MANFPKIWVVFLDGEIMGIYPNDEPKADQTIECLAIGGYKAMKIEYSAE